MSELHRADLSPAAEKRIYPALPDAELTERIRAGAPTAYPATQELRRRHLPAVLSYARLCGRNQVAGNQLATQAFALAAQEACRGIDPRGPWRHHLLMLIQRVAATWATSGRRLRLDPEFAAWLDDTVTTAPDRPRPQRRRLEERSAMLGGFSTLPERTCGIIWYGVVDDGPDDEVTTFVGLRTAPVIDMKAKALEAMRQAYLRTHLQRAGDKRCQGYRRIIEAAVRPGDSRRTEDLDLHLAECPHCNQALRELTRMVDSPRTVLAEGLLGWGGAAYVAAGPVRGLDALETAVEQTQQERSATAVRSAPITPPPEPETGDREDRRIQRASRPHVVATVAAAAAAVLAMALLTADAADTRPAGSSGTLPGPTTTVTETATAIAPVPSVTMTATVRPPRKTRPSPRPTRTTPAPKPTRSQGTGGPSLVIPGDGYTLVVNADSGLCLDIANGYLEKRTDVITAPCTGADTQLWRLDSRGLLHTRADSEFCLDSRGSTDRGVGIWTCSSADGDNGENLMFSIDRRGTIRPRIAPDFALTPDAGYPGSALVFQPAYDRADQRWTTGS